MFQDALSKLLNTIMRCDSLTLHRLDIQLNFNTFVKKNPEKINWPLWDINSFIPLMFNCNISVSA